MKFRIPLRTNEVPEVEEIQRPNDTEKSTAPAAADSLTALPDEKGDTFEVNTEFQHGVQAAEAITQIWRKEHLVVAYLLIWIVQFMQAFASGINSTLTPYVTSSFSAHSLTALTYVIASLIGGLIKLPYAKLIDIWGRPQGFALMVASMTLGLVMMAGCNNVKTFCAAQVFYNIGYNGIDFTVTIFIADTSSLRNRGFWLAYSSSPWLAVTWAYGPAAQSILKTMGYRWGFGIFAIIFPVVCIPLFSLFYYHQRKAEKAGLIQILESGRTWAESIYYYCREFDIIGLLLIASGLALFLLSFNLYSYQKNEWRSPLIICFIIIGGLLIVAFALYEKYIAPVTFIPWQLIKNRTVFFTYTMVAAIYCAYYVWDSYFYSMLVVVFNQSVTDATYITNIYTIGSCFWAFIMGIIIRYNGRLKWQALYFGSPITILAVGLMIKFRQPDTNIGYIVMCQLFIAFGGGTLVVCEQMTVMAVSSHQHIPAVLAMESMLASVGGSIGSTIATAMWTGIFPKKLAKFLPPESQADLLTIYGDLTVQSSYPLGSPTRDAIDHAYGDTQRLMLIASTCLYGLSLFSIMLWKDVNVKKIKQVRGTVW
ncbi:siderophore iron transporter-like protein mirB [Xylogone sp. PMI_703]|nr:siderophore iron transporter-like protein mirB [Xylogone sp. PMI_703]